MGPRELRVLSSEIFDDYRIINHYQSLIMLAAPLLFLGLLILLTHIIYIIWTCCRKRPHQIFTVWSRMFSKTLLGAAFVVLRWVIRMKYECPYNSF